MANKDHEVTIATRDGEVRTLRVTAQQARDYERLWKTSSTILWVRVKPAKGGR